MTSLQKPEIARKVRQEGAPPTRRNEVPQFLIASTVFQATRIATLLVVAKSQRIYPRPVVPLRSWRLCVTPFCSAVMDESTEKATESTQRRKGAEDSLSDLSFFALLAALRATLLQCSHSGLTILFIGHLWVNYRYDDSSYFLPIFFRHSKSDAAPGGDWGRYRLSSSDTCSSALSELTRKL